MIKRVYDGILREHFSESDKIAFISGPRQVGKTTSTRNIFSDPVYLNWDNADHRAAILKGPGHIAELAGAESLIDRKIPVIFDELHKYKGWKNFIKGFYDTYKEKFSVCVTGSARLNVYRKHGDSLMGRYFNYRMNPLSAGELAAPEVRRDLYITPVDIGREKFSSLLNYGGFPEPFIKADRRFYNKWSRLRDEQLFREELREIANIQELKKAELLALRFRENASGALSYSNMAQDLKVSVDTVRRWTDVLEEIYYLFRVYPYTKNISKSIRREPKTYLRDWSEVHDRGSRNENFVACHLRKAVDFYNDTGLGNFSLGYIRDKTKREVDFIISEDGRPWLLCEVKSGTKKISRHLRHFHEILKPEHSFQITMDMDYVDKDCFASSGPVRVPAATFLSQLV
ncbi:MAG: ATP-binding protein [Fibrobacterota bacterium]